MKRLSIKTRITIWYTVSMLLLAAAAVSFMLSAGIASTRDSAKTALTEVVEDAFSYIEYDDGQLEIDDDIDLYRRGVYLAVYGDDGVLIVGGIPKEPAAAALLPGEMTDVGDSWYVYDSYKKLYSSGGAYVRGAATVSAAQDAQGIMARLALIALPFLVALAAAGGHILTARSFLPVRRITDTARQIEQSGDLSRRIELPPGEDEIHTLAAAFDSMFDRLEGAFEKEKQFTSDASHELRTPTAVIISETEYALENPAEAQEALKTILIQSRRMSALISQLLMLARADSGKAKLCIETLDISELAEMAAEEARERARAATVSIHLDAGEHIMCRADETMLIRLFMNLIDNAVKYSRPGGNVWITIKRNGDMVAGSVRDDGVGMDADTLEHVWERFYRADKSHTGEGSGLGLPIVKWIAEAHGGSVSVRSAPDKGSEFTFDINGYSDVDATGEM